MAKCVSESLFPKFCAPANVLPRDQTGIVGVQRVISELPDAPQNEEPLCSSRSQGFPSSPNSNEDILTQIHALFNNALLQQQFQMQKVLEDLLAPQASQLTRHQQYLEQLLAKSYEIEVAMSSQPRKSPALSPALHVNSPVFQSSFPVMHEEVVPDKQADIKDVSANHAGTCLHEDPSIAGVANENPPVNDSVNHASEQTTKADTADVAQQNPKSMKQNPKSMRHTASHLITEAAAWERHAFEAASGWIKEEQLKLEGKKEFISGEKSKLHNPSNHNNIMLKIVQSQTFDHVSASAIILNTIVIGWQADQKVKNPWQAELGVFQTFEAFFLLLFLS